MLSVMQIPIAIETQLTPDIPRKAGLVTWARSGIFVDLMFGDRKRSRTVYIQLDPRDICKLVKTSAAVVALYHLRQHQRSTFNIQT